MIIKKNTTWLRLLFCVKGSSFEDTWLRILGVTAVAVVVTVFRDQISGYTLTTTPFTLIGVSLGIFLGFRNNASYDRFWEGRKLWGAMVNTARTLARQSYTLIDSEDAELPEFRRRFVHRVIAFTHAFRHHLRSSDPTEDIKEFLSQEDLSTALSKKHRPLALLKQLGDDLRFARGKGWIHELHVPAVDAQLVEVSNILGACERIRSTPIPFTYTILIHRIVAFYCLLLPFGIIDTVGLVTPVVVFLISHAFFGLDAIGDEIEEPFGLHTHDLPIHGISRNIEINLRELLGETELPEQLEPTDGVLV
ncbi:MAG: bestrophin family ion channel [Planctomycetota bacterium]